MIERGLYKTERAPVLYRALQAVNIFQAAKLAAQDMDLLSPEQTKIAMEMTALLGKKRRKRR